MSKRTTQLYERSVAMLDNYLALNNMRRTKERYHVLSQMCSFPSAFTAVQLMVLCSAELALSRATVYNALQVFLDAGIVTVLPSYAGSKEVQYEISTRKVSYMRFKCEECGREVIFEDKIFRTMVMEKKYANFVPKHFTINVYGKCKVCRSLVKNKS